MKITVLYNGQFDQELDKEIEEALRTKGWEREASGYGFGQRDIDFVRKEKKDERSSRP